MQIKVSKKLYNMLQNIPMPDGAKASLRKEKAGVMRTDEESEQNYVSIYINENYLIEVINAFIGFVVPFTGILETAYMMGESFGKRIDAIENKYHMPPQAEESKIEPDWDMK